MEIYCCVDEGAAPIQVSLCHRLYQSQMAKYLTEVPFRGRMAGLRNHPPGQINPDENMETIEKACRWIEEVRKLLKRLGLVLSETVDRLERFRDEDIPCFGQQNEERRLLHGIAKAHSELKALSRQLEAMYRGLNEDHHRTVGGRLIPSSFRQYH